MEQDVGWTPPETEAMPARGRGVKDQAEALVDSGDENVPNRSGPVVFVRTESR